MATQNQDGQETNETSEAKTFDPFDGLWDETVETKEEFINRSRGTYSASLGGPSKLASFDRFLRPEHGSLPDIDGNFVNGDRVRAETMEYLKDKYENSAQQNIKSSDNDTGSESPEDFEAFLDPEHPGFPIDIGFGDGDSVRTGNTEWVVTKLIGTNHFFR
jgi:hypothetical protein